MSLEIKGNLIESMPSVSGKSTNGNTWIKKTVIVKTEEQYDNLYAFEIFGQQRVAEFENNIRVGDFVTVSFNIKTRLHNDIYYTNLSAWRFQK